VFPFGADIIDIRIILLRTDSNHIIGLEIPDLVARILEE